MAPKPFEPFTNRVKFTDKSTKYSVKTLVDGEFKDFGEFYSVLYNDYPGAVAILNELVSMPKNEPLFLAVIDPALWEIQVTLVPVKKEPEDLSHIIRGED